jgi:hypothetical protein
MTYIRTALAAALMSAAALPALAVDTKPAVNPDTAGMNQNNAQAGINDVGQNPAPNTQVAANMTTGTAEGISAAPSPTQRKATHGAAQRAKADADEAETTRQLDMQAAALAKPDTSVR